MSSSNRSAETRTIRRHREGRQEVTLSDVARMAGVSAITASRALNKSHLVAPETAKRIQEAAERLAYVPNLLAGGLASRRSRLVTAVIPTTNPVFQELIDSLRDELLSGAYHLMLGLSGYTNSTEDGLMEAVISRRPDGIVLTGVHHSAALKRMLSAVRVPVVETWDLTPDPIDIVVGFSNEEVGRAAASYLISRGSRHPAIIAGDDERAQARRVGFEAAAHEHGLRGVVSVALTTPTSIGKGRQGLARALAENPNLDGVFCSSDVLAMGVLFEAISRAIPVPERLRVMGFGNLSATADTHPALTSVVVDGARIGREAARLLMARMDGGPTPGQRVCDVGFRIAVRDSA